MIDSPVEHSAAVALRRLLHPERDGVVVEDNPVSEPIRRLSLDMHRRFKAVRAAADKLIALVRATPTLQDDDTGKATISLHFDTQMLSRVDAAARRQGISSGGY
jgi:hypothetical protein